METERQKKLRAIHRIGSIKILTTYNKLCGSCKIKSVAAVRKGGDALKNIVSKYCSKCKIICQSLMEDLK